MRVRGQSAGRSRGKPPRAAVRDVTDPIQPSRSGAPLRGPAKKQRGRRLATSWRGLTALKGLTRDTQGVRRRVLRVIAGRCEGIQLPPGPFDPGQTTFVHGISEPFPDWGGQDMWRDMNAAPVVFVVDDDADVREGLKSLLTSVGLRSRGFRLDPRISTAQGRRHSELPGARCAPAGHERARLPGRVCRRRHADIPIIFLSGHGDIRMTVRAMKAGAVEFLTKPVREQDLLDAINVALERDRARRENDEKAA